MTHELNEADLDIVQVACECGNTFDMPWDAVAFGALASSSMQCGQCGESNKMNVVADPSPNKK